MKIIEASVEILTPINGDDILRHIERCGRVCYKSEDLINRYSAQKFAQSILDRGHEAVLEHFNITVKFITDRGVSHEIVRHRLASYCQESTRYCNYAKGKHGNEITVIKPCFFKGHEMAPPYQYWKIACEQAEKSYLDILSFGHSPQEARSVLPNSLKTEVIMTANLREWRHFLRLRTSPAAHPQMREIAIPLLEKFKAQIPVVFEDIEA